ncbi:MAG: TPM domain-containing protein [Bacteroidaceae bacterium]|nr:TPM domain-containing protein [Bacteroidaceae bacterium]
MNIPFNNKKTSRTKGCLIPTLIFIALVIFISIGRELYGNVSYGTLLLVAAAVTLVIIAILNACSKQYSAEVDSLKDKRKELVKIGDKYNKEVHQLEAEFRKEKNNVSTRDAYSKKYDLIYDNYRAESTAFVNQWDSAHPREAKLKNMWQRGIKACVIAMLACGGLTMGIKMREAEPQGIAALMENRLWNADNIPMPHMQDANLYVSNPDSILSPQTVDSMNVILRRLDTNLGIESAVVIVGHIEGDDPIPMIRGIYEKYKVGRNDRGLVIVVGYLDHSYFIAPGRNLESDLTDLECNHLAQDYLIPSMKAELPDSGMLYLTRGVYALMAGKEMPQMSALSAAQDDSDDSIGMTDTLLIIIYTIMLIALMVYNMRKSKKLGWAGLSYPMFLASNPFSYSDSSSGSGSYSGGSSYSSGGSSSSGGYGGGSWGGGGSGGRW